MTEQAGLGVYQAISKVQKELAKQGITKSRNNKEQHYSFRGIDDVYNALSSLLAETGLCIMPRVLSRELHERKTAKGNPLFNVVVEAEFVFVSSSDGSSHVVKTYGEAMDTADKATNKAMSAAYKYACLQTFCIPTEGENDADERTHLVAPPGVFETEAARKQFVDNCVEAIGKTGAYAALRDQKDLNAARWNAMKTSDNNDDVAGFNKISEAYNTRYSHFKKLSEDAKAKPKTVEEAKSAAAALGDDEIPF